ncbi:hypothetical protein [Flavobacterium saccharophilum]|uniref:Uncharacterized protein n=1 Tax=Flavobacterium saccharophilum TaxID=29534 RepID=A0A1M7AD45_9FLAO|nr:hypothetical protein [Flavobacterium saccharophilum]SHL40535.1 hypothetical protein SAMN05444366_0621 [Flavobacterium saccharophilum]
MKINLCLIFLIVVNFVFSQNKEKATHTINFKYEQRPNCVLVKKGLYANKQYLEANFPNLKFELVENNQTSTGFIALKEFSKDDLKKLSSLLSHTSRSIEGSYDPVKNYTKFVIKLDIDYLNNSFAEILNTKFRKHSYSLKIDYNKKKIKYLSSSSAYEETFDESVKEIKFTANNSLNGKFIYKTNNRIYTDSVELNDQYNSKITPYILFSNTDLGVQKIINVEYTIDLKSHSK